MKKIYFQITMIFFLMLVFRTNIYAGKNDSENSKFKNVIQYSDFEDGHIDYKYELKDLKGKVHVQTISYYKYMRVIDAWGKTIDLYLYNLTNSEYNKEIEKYQEQNQVVDYFLNSEKKDVKNTYGQWFMIPISSQGKGRLSDNEFNNKTYILNHNPNDFTEISKESNSWLLYFLPLNTNSTGSSYSKYPDLTVPNKTEFVSMIKQINKKLGTNYSTSTSTENMAKWLTTSRMGDKLYGFKDIGQTWLSKVSLKTVTNTLNQKNVYDSSQYTFFLAMKDNKGNILHGTPRNVYSANIYSYANGGYMDISFPRDSNIDSSRTLVSVLPRLQKDPKKNSPNISKGAVNKDFENMNGNYKNASLDMIKTLVNIFQTFGGYEFFANQVSKESWTVSIGEEEIYAKDIPKTVKKINALGEQNYTQWLYYMRMVFYKASQVLEIQNYSSSYNESEIHVSTGPGVYNTFVSSRIKILDTSSILITNDALIRNTSQTEPIRVVSLYKVFSEIKYDRILELKKAESVDEGKNRAEKLLIAAFKNIDVGSYLTGTEIEQGSVSQEEELEVGVPYIVMSNIRYNNGFTDVEEAKSDSIADYLNDNKTYDTSQNTLTEITNKRGFALLQESYMMTESDPQVQFMMITHDKANTASISSSSLKYLGKSKYTSNILNPKNKAKYFNELYSINNGTSSFLTSQIIKFKENDIADGKRLSGIVSTKSGTGSGSYFEFVQSDFSTSSLEAIKKVLNRAVYSDSVKSKLQSLIQDATGDLIKIKANYNTASKLLYGYWKLKTDNIDGEYDPINNFYYSTTFIIPEYSAKVSNSKLYESDELGNKAKSTDLKFYNETGKTSNLTVSNKANETKSVKFITSIAKNDNGFFEQDYKEALNTYIKSDNIFKILDDIFNDIKTGQKVSSISVIENTSKSSYNYDKKTAKINITNSDATKFRNNAYTVLNKYIENDNSAFNLRLNNISKADINLKSVVDGLSLSQLCSILLNVFVDNSNQYNDQDFVIYNVKDSSKDDLIISNSRNGYNLDGYRKTIDWDGSNKYDITTTLNKGDTTSILDNNFTTNNESSKKITNKNTNTSPITNATKLYTTLYVGRNPEGTASTGDSFELNLSDFNILITENFNQNMNDYKATQNSNKNALNNLIKKLETGITRTQLQTALNLFKSSYTKGFLSKLYLNESFIDFDYIKIVPTEYKEMESMKLVDDKATNVVMGNWKSINKKDLKSVKVKPGTIIKYEIEYSIPSSTNFNSTWEYIKTHTKDLYKNNEKWLKDYESLITNGIDFTLVPTATLTGSTYKSKDIYNKVNETTLNDFTKEFIKSNSTRNLYFTKIEVVDKNGNIINTKTIDHNSNTTSANININTNNADDLYVRAYMAYENLSDKTAPTINSNIKINASNSFYKNTLSGSVQGSLTGKMNNGDTNEYKEKIDMLTIPLSQNILNSALEQQIVLTIPNNTDNQIHTDWERAVITVGSSNSDITNKDNEISDIILYKGNNNGETCGDVSRDNYSSKAQKLSTNLNENYYVMVKVKRNSGNMKEKVDNTTKGYLYVECIVNGKERVIENIYQPNGNGVFTNALAPLNGSVSLDNLKNAGEYIYFGFPLGTSQIGSNGISYLNVKAQYRVGDYLKDNLDNQDTNLNNNTWEESWGTGVDFYVENLQAPEDIKYDEKKGSTEDMQISASFTAGLDMNNSVYETNSKEVTLYIYQYKESGTGSGVRLTPKTINGSASGSNYYLGNGLYKIPYTSSFEKTISATWDKQKFTKGLYRYYADINWTNKISGITETNLTNNVIQEYMNVFAITGDIPKSSSDICPTPNTRNEWQVRFSWNNYEYARPGGNEYRVDVYDSKGNKIGSYMACGHYCGNRSGPDNGRTNWGPDGNGSLYYEQHSLEIYLWTSGSKAYTNVTNKTANVKTGEIFQVIFKSVHKSNRDILPNSPSGRAPFANTYATHVGPCNYLYRSPDVSNVIGPRQVYINISNASFALAKTFTPTSTENYSTVNKTYVFEPLGKIQVPLTNKNQSIYYTITSLPYAGHISDSLHPKKKLCTTVSLTLKVTPSSTALGGEQDDNYPNENGSDAWIN